MPEDEGPQLAGSDGRKGYPTKAIQRKGVSEVSPLLAYQPVALSEPELQAVCNEHSVLEAGIELALEEFNAERRQWFAKDGPKTVTDFRLWLRTKKARPALAAHKRPTRHNYSSFDGSGMRANCVNGYAGIDGVTAADRGPIPAEPAGWREVLKDDEGDSTLEFCLRCEGWPMPHEHYTRHVIRLMQARSQGTVSVNVENVV